LSHAPPNPASAKARTGNGDGVCCGGEQFPDSGTQPKNQAQTAAGRGAPHLRLVAPLPPTRPRRRLAVRIHVLDGPAPYGMSRTIRLIGPDDVDRLVDFALQLEARA
jgi:hypothetical protein